MMRARLDERLWWPISLTWSPRHWWIAHWGAEVGCVPVPLVKTGARNMPGWRSMFAQFFRVGPVVIGLGKDRDVGLPTPTESMVHSLAVSEPYRHQIGRGYLLDHHLIASSDA